MIRLIRTRELRRLQDVEQRLGQVLVQSLRTELTLHKRAELAEQALESYQQQTTYWKKRAERFIDTIGHTGSILNGPVMTETPARPADDVRNIFSALGKTSRKVDPAATPTPAAPVFSEVDPVIAQQLVAEVLSS